MKFWTSSCFLSTAKTANAANTAHAPNTANAANTANTVLTARLANAPNDSDTRIHRTALSPQRFRVPLAHTIEIQHREALAHIRKNS